MVLPLKNLWKSKNDDICKNKENVVTRQNKHQMMEVFCLLRKPADEAGVSDNSKEANQYLKKYWPLFKVCFIVFSNFDIDIL